MKRMSRKGYRRELARTKQNLKLSQDMYESLDNRHFGLQRAFKRLTHTALFLLLAAVAFGLLAVKAHAQTDTTVYVKQFHGSDVGTKTANAQASTACNTPGLKCIVVFDPSLANWPTGTMPAQCATCIWVDWRTPAITPFPQAPTVMQMAGNPLIGVSVNGNTNAYQTVGISCASSPCLAAGAENSVGKTFDFYWLGYYVTVNTSESVSLKITVGSNSLTLGLPNLVASSPGQGFIARLTCTVTTAGNNGQAQCAGTISVSQCVNCATMTTSNGIQYSDILAPSIPYDWTTSFTPTLSMAFGTASTSNVAAIYEGYTRTWN